MKDIDDDHHQLAHGKLGLYIMDYYIFVSLFVSVSFLQHLVRQ